MPLSASARAKIPCRNVLIHGYCKFKDKGCEFNHDRSSFPLTLSSSQQPSSSSSAATASSSSSHNNANSTVVESAINIPAARKTSSPSKPGSLSYANITNPSKTASYHEASSVGAASPGLSDGGIVGAVNTKDYTGKKKNIIKQAPLTHSTTDQPQYIAYIPEFTPNIDSDHDSAPKTQLFQDFVPERQLDEQVDENVDSNDYYMMNNGQIDYNSYYHESNDVQQIYSGDQNEYYSGGNDITDPNNGMDYYPHMYGMNSNTSQMAHSSISASGSPNGISLNSHGMVHSPTYISNQQNQHLLTPHHSLGLNATDNVEKKKLNYLLYTGPLPHVTNLTSKRKVAASTFFIQNNLREVLQRKVEETAQVAGPSLQSTALPREVFHYHSLYPLDSEFPESSKTFGFPTLNYKAFCMNTNSTFALRRIAQFRLINDSMVTACDPWKDLPSHPGIVGLKETFTTRAFGDNSLVFVYDYHPLSKTLFEKYIINQKSNGPNNMEWVDERVIWSVVLQISSALKFIHSNGLAARTVELSKIIETSKNRFRLNCCGIMDVTERAQTAIDMTAYQQEDLLKLGQLIVALCTRSLKSLHYMSRVYSYISRHYSPALKDLVVYLLSKPSLTKTIDDVVAIAGSNLLSEATYSYSNNDYLEGQLSSELENSRISRLLIKLGCINERPEYHHDTTWSETGDRYLLKLFRDYIFHQTDDYGRPIVDLAFMLQCLNKLDAGIDEKIMLTSRDEQACLIVSYKDLKVCIENTFSELLL